MAKHSSVMDGFISRLSTHLFWDMNVAKLDPKRSEKLIVQRVLEYGLMEDWNELISFYGKDQVKEIAMKLKTLESTALSFLCTIYRLDKDDFRCYKHRQSNPNSWNY